MCKEHENEWQCRQLNKPAPTFNAKTTHGTLKLEDYKGNGQSFLIPADLHQ